MMAIAATFTACSSDDTTGNQDNGAVNFTAVIGNSVTRASGGTSAYTGPLTLWYGNVKGTVSAKYTYAGGAWSTTSPLYWDNLTAASDKYAFFATNNEYPLHDDATGGTVAADQTAADGYAKADLIAAYYETAKRNQTLQFSLNHLMAQLTVSLSSSEGSFTAAELRAASVVAQSISTGYSMTWASSITATAVTASKENVNLCADASNETSTDNFIFRAIIPAQTVGNIVITINGNTYTMTMNKELNAGENTIQPVLAKKTGVTIGTVNVTDWVESSMTGKDIAIDGVTVPTKALSGITEAGSLFINTDSKTGTYPVTYGDATASIDYTRATPLLWDNLAVGKPYTYNAIFVPTAETGASNQEKDYLTCTTDAAPWGTTPTFALTHAMAKLTIKLQCTDGTYTDDKLKGATVNISIAKSAAVSTAASSFGITTDVSDKTVTMTNAGATEDAFGTYTAIVYPQITGDITFKINGNDFTMNGIALTTPGQNHAITINVKKTGIEFGTVTVTDWGTTNLGAGDIDINN